MSHDGDAFPSVLAALKADPSTEFGAPGAQVELLGRIDGPFSFVQRVRIQTPARSVHAYAKILKPYQDGPDEVARAERMLRREYTATSTLYHTLRQDGEIGAVRPIAFLPQHRAIVTEEVPGRPMSEFLDDPSRSADERLAVARRVGAWIRIYQSLGDSTGTVPLSERRDYLDARLKTLEDRVISPDERQEVLTLFDALASQLPREVAAVPIHADLTPMNIIADVSGRIAVLDFTMAKTGTSVHDIAHVFFHLELWGARQHKPDIARELQRALLAGYSPALSASDALFQLMLLQHVVCHAALLGARHVPVVDVLYRWFVRRRWRACRRMLQAPAPERCAA